MVFFFIILVMTSCGFLMTALRNLTNNLYPIGVMMEEEIRNTLGSIYDRLTRIETLLESGDYNNRLKFLESEMATLRGQKSVLTVLASVGISLAVSLLLKVL
jgi:hypothetical protein